MNTPNTTDDRLSHLARTNARWRLLAVSSITLMAGVVIGGMGSGAQPSQPDADPAEVIDYVGTAETIFRVHRDGSLTYLKIPQGERTGFGYYDWGKVKIDTRYTSRTLPQP
ncbi:MAG: hypothetical protein WD114_05765 [Phycisphaerales bacterium]